MDSTLTAPFGAASLALAAAWLAPASFAGSQHRGREAAAQRLFSRFFLTRERMRRELAELQQQLDEVRANAERRARQRSRSGSDTEVADHSAGHDAEDDSGCAAGDHSCNDAPEAGRDAEEN